MWVKVQEPMAKNRGFNSMDQEGCLIINSENGFLKGALDFESKLQRSNLSMDDICQILVLSTFTQTPPISAFIAQVNCDATFSMVGAWGVKPEYKASRQNVSLLDEVPLAQSIRLNKAMWFSDRAEIQRNFPELTTIPNFPKGEGLACLPIPKMGVPIGSLALVGDNLPISEQGILYMELLALLIASRLEPNTRQPQARAENARSWLLGQSLTPREKMIQSLMAEGKTNFDISRELGVSVSTVRQDAISLFSKLGVNNRLDAAKKISLD